MIEHADSLRQFFDPADFADAVTVNGVRVVHSIFDFDLAAAFSIDAAGVGMTCMGADAIEIGDTIDRGGASYRVASRLADDGAVVTWQLQRVA